MMSLYDMYNQSDIRVANMDFIRCRSLQLQWYLPTAFLKQLKVRQASISASLSNPFFIAFDKEWEGRDPETADWCVPTWTIPVRTHGGLPHSISSWRLAAAIRPGPGPADFPPAHPECSSSAAGGSIRAVAGPGLPWYASECWPSARQASPHASDNPRDGKHGPAKNLP